MPRTLSKEPIPNVGERIRELRKSRNWSLKKMTEALRPYVHIVLEGKTGESRISSIEKSKKGLTPELANAYSKVFNVTLEYVFCLSNDMRPEDKSIRETLNLTNITISKIRDFSNSEVSPKQIAILNLLFESDFMSELVHSLDSFVYTTTVYRQMVTLDFDDRENDKEIVNLLPRWKLDKSVSASVDKIAKLLEENEIPY